eukprot:gene10126-21949_t
MGKKLTKKAGASSAARKQHQKVAPANDAESSSDGSDSDSDSDADSSDNEAEHVAKTSSEIAEDGDDDDSDGSDSDSDGESSDDDSSDDGAPAAKKPAAKQLKKKKQGDKLEQSDEIKTLVEIQRFLSIKRLRGVLRKKCREANTHNTGKVPLLAFERWLDEGARAAALALGAAVTEASASIAAASKPGSKQVSSRVRVEHKKEGMMHYSIEKNAKLPFFK